MCTPAPKIANCCCAHRHSQVMAMPGENGEVTPGKGQKRGGAHPAEGHKGGEQHMVTLPTPQNISGLCPPASELLSRVGAPCPAPVGGVGVPPSTPQPPLPPCPPR